MKKRLAIEKAEKIYKEIEADERRMAEDLLSICAVLSENKQG